MTAKRLNICNMLFRVDNPPDGFRSVFFEKIPMANGTTIFVRDYASRRNRSPEDVERLLIREFDRGLGDEILKIHKSGATVVLHMDYFSNLADRFIVIKSDYIQNQSRRDHALKITYLPCDDNCREEIVTIPSGIIRLSSEYFMTIEVS